MNSDKKIVSLADRATIALEQKNYQTALDTYGKALEMAKTEKRSRLVAVLLNRIGDTYQAQGEIKDAVIAYEAALQALDTTWKVRAITLSPTDLLRKRVRYAIGER